MGSRDEASQEDPVDNCMICGSRMEPSFSKVYQPEEVGEFLTAPLRVNYARCRDCGFVASITHRKMEVAAWSKLNEDFHHHLESNLGTVGFNQPPYPEQAFAIACLAACGAISTSVAVDYGSGYGSMAQLLRKYLSIELDLYDPYVQQDNGMNYIANPKPGMYDLVVCSAMFEHVLARNELDCVSDLVSDTGSLMVHTLVCEEPPSDPTWFYLTPVVHCSFHTNRSMSRLMEQWGYVASIYSLPARSWWLLKAPSVDVKSQLKELNRSLGRDWFFYSEGFLDYWK